MLYCTYLWEVGQNHESKCRESEESGPACDDRHGKGVSSLACDVNVYQRRDTQLINAVRKLGRTHMAY